MKRLLAGLIAAASLLLAQPPLPEAARAQLQTGIGILQGAQAPEDLDRAIACFRAAVKAAPQSAEPHFFLGTALATTRSRSRQAIDALIRYLELAPGAPDAEAVKAEIARLEGLRAWRRTSGGAGFSIAALGKGFVVRSVFPDSPVAQSGLRRGDRLVGINRKSLEGLDLVQVTQLLDGPPESTCLLEITRGGKPVSIVFKRSLLHTAPSGVLAIEEGDFSEEVLRAPVPVVVVLWSPWCPFCPKVLASASALAAAHGPRLKVVSVDVDEAPDLVQHLRVTGIPAVRFLRNGVVVDGLQGADPGALQAKVQGLLAPAGRLGIQLGASAPPEPPGVVVRAIQPGSPAAAADLRPGDRLLAADGADLQGFSVAQAGAALRGAPGSSVTLKVQRPGASAPHTVTLVRQAFQP